ncbi:hypothetical protein PJL18_04034 [Paenarthrobacter nicotinovorans]|nr:hypothetical protein [Paenarthrobacter nicotinovorans]
MVNEGQQQERGHRDAPEHSCSCLRCHKPDTAPPHYCTAKFLNGRRSNKRQQGVGSPFLAVLKDGCHSTGDGRGQCYPASQDQVLTVGCWSKQSGQKPVGTSRCQEHGNRQCPQQDCEDEAGPRDGSWRKKDSGGGHRSPGKPPTQHHGGQHAHVQGHLDGEIEVAEAQSRRQYGSGRQLQAPARHRVIPSQAGSQHGATERNPQ